VCPDTAYAALSPIAGRQKLAVALGAYAGFKLLFPAGPLIVATGLGLGQGQLLWYGLLVFLPVWGVGVWWAWQMGGNAAAGSDGAAPLATNEGTSGMGRLMAPFVFMALLLAVGMVWESRNAGLLYLTQPKGALMAAALLAWWMVPPEERRECLEAALRRTGSLLLVIGMASAFGAVLLGTGVLDGWVLAGDGWRGVLSLFVLTAVFKVIQGSSMATFAAVTPVAAAFMANSPLPMEAAVLAICAGSFVSILPNDSFYWLVRRDALVSASEWRSLTTLAVGALLQALTALAMVVLLVL
jgi:GntP family gluconate:H+ symporter